MLVNIGKKTNSLLILIILVFFIIFNQILILKPVLERGVMPEDWDMLLGYKIQQQRRPFLIDRISYIWSTQDKLYKNQIIYIGIFNDIFGINKTAYILINFGLKILASVSIYLLLLTLFRNRLFAFIASAFFSFSPSAAGSLAYIVTGDDYLALIFMSLFGITYYRLLTKGKGLLRASLFILLVILSSPLRMHPFLLVPISIEGFLVLKSLLAFGFNENSLRVLMVSLKRLLFFFLPVYSLYLRSVSGDFKIWHSFIKILGQVRQGNWHTLLPPIFSSGFTVADNNIIAKLGNILNQTAYVDVTLLERLVMVLVCVTLIATGILTWAIKPKRPVIFFMATYLAANILNMFILFCIKNIDNIPAAVRAPFNPHNFLVVFVGGYYLIIGIAVFLEWLIHRRNHKLFLLLLPASVLWTYVFSSFTWLEIGSAIDYGHPVHRYLTVPALGTSFFAAALITILISRIKTIKFVYIRYFFGCLIGLFSVLIFFHQIEIVNSYYKNENAIGRSGFRQELLKSRFGRVLGKTDPEKPLLIYIEAGNNKRIGADYENTFFNIIQYTIFYNFPSNDIIYSCRSFVYTHYAKLFALAQFKNGEIFFTKESNCTTPDGRYGPTITYKTDDFYAFLIEDDDFFDIKQSVLTKLKADLNEK